MDVLLNNHANVKNAWNYVEGGFEMDVSLLVCQGSIKEPLLGQLH